MNRCICKHRWIITINSLELHKDTIVFLELPYIWCLHHWFCYCPVITVKLLWNSQVKTTFVESKTSPRPGLVESKSRPSPKRFESKTRPSPGQKKKTLMHDIIKTVIWGYYLLILFVSQHPVSKIVTTVTAWEDTLCCSEHLVG